MIIRYTRIHYANPAKWTHKVEFYSGYSKETGLVGTAISEVEKSRATDIVNAVKYMTSGAQRGSLKMHMKYCEDGIIDEQGTRYKI